MVINSSISSSKIASTSIIIAMNAPNAERLAVQSTVTLNHTFPLTKNSVTKLLFEQCVGVLSSKDRSDYT